MTDPTSRVGFYGNALRAQWNHPPVLLRGRRGRRAAEDLEELGAGRGVGDGALGELDQDRLVERKPGLEVGVPLRQKRGKHLQGDQPVDKLLLLGDWKRRAAARDNGYDKHRED